MHFQIPYDKLPILTIQTHWKIITFNLKSIKNRINFTVEISSSLHLNITLNVTCSQKQFPVLLVNATFLLFHI